jgi:Tat protein secretion system quality control protein TatD with DNase activity
MRQSHLFHQTILSKFEFVEQMVIPLLPFDAHNHVHMGPTNPLYALLSSPKTIGTVVDIVDSEAEREQRVAAGLARPSLSGMAIMSTTLSDFPVVSDLAQRLPSEASGFTKIVPCYGIHPWFLHELTTDDWIESDSGIGTGDSWPRWVNDLKAKLMAEPHSIVGEIGLDGFHFDNVTRELTSPMDLQVKAFRYQLELAFQLKRPVSIHAVQCWGPLMEALSTVKRNQRIPPRVYFHAFSGKEATVDQLLGLCNDKLQPPSVVPAARVFFGFAPVVNFRSPKTANVVRKVGIERLVLESDHEDSRLVSDSIQECIEYLAAALEMTSEEVVDRTTRNAFRLYNLELN